MYNSEIVRGCGLSRFEIQIAVVQSFHDFSRSGSVAVETYKMFSQLFTVCRDSDPGRTEISQLFTICRVSDCGHTKFSWYVTHDLWYNRKFTRYFFRTDTIKVLREKVEQQNSLILFEKLLWIVSMIFEEILQARANRVVLLYISMVRRKACCAAFVILKNLFHELCKLELWVLLVCFISRKTKVWMQKHQNELPKMIILCRPGGRFIFCWANILILFHTTSFPLNILFDRDPWTKFTLSRKHSTLKLLSYIILDQAYREQGNGWRWFSPCPGDPRLSC